MRTFINLIMASLFVFGLVACVAGIGTDKDGDVRPMVQLGGNAGQVIDAVDEKIAAGEIVPDPSSTLLEDLLVIGGSLIGVGGLGVAGRKVIKTVAARKAQEVVDVYDAQPFTPADVASIEVAKAASADPKPTALKPVV